MAQMKLKDPHICRVFFSSPFNGLEEEREELTKIYWPQLQSLCASQGIQFVPVDMRWGITTELSDSAQTINICLRELDRSDVFVGFFGQVKHLIFLERQYVVPLDMKGCICQFSQWQIHPFISKGTMYAQQRKYGKSL